MQVARPDGGQSYAESILAWWRDAGVEYLCQDEPLNWLEMPAANPLPARTIEKAGIEAASPAVDAKRPGIAPPKSDWPKDFASFVAAIRSDASLPGNGYGRRLAPPVAAENAELMVVCDFPDEAELDAGQMGHGASGQLLKAMVAACGYDPAHVHIAALAHSRPASGALPSHDAAELARLARHHISLVRPQRLLFLGTAVSEILTEKDLMTARAGLPDFNQDGRSMATVATFHPRTLIARPILKRQAWQDLQAIVKKDSP